MKDFVKWLGVNEKVAKVAVWLLIIMVFLIITNTMLGSLGFPNYQITYDNLVKIDTNQVSELILSGLIAILNFYTMILLVFRIKETKRIFKYALLYLMLNIIINSIFGYIVLQIFIVLFCMIFCYLYSNKNKKYIIYFLISYVLTVIIQGLWYSIKIQFINYQDLNNVAIAFLTIDYFIIIGIIILVKEIYLKKRGVKKWDRLDAYSGLANSKTKTNSPKKQLKK